MGNQIDARRSIIKATALFLLIVGCSHTYEYHSIGSKFIRPDYFKRIQSKDVNSWPTEADSTGIFSAKITVQGCKKLFIIYNKKGAIIQSQEMKDTSNCDSDYKAEFIDMNFDGLPDLKINLQLSAQNSWDEYWLFSLSDKKFHYHEQLSNLISVHAYPREKVIESYYYEGMEKQSRVDYRFEGDKLVPSKL